MIGSGENDPVVPHKPVQQGGGGVILGWHTSLRWRHDDPHGGARIAGRGGWAGQRCHGPQRGSASLEGVLERGSWAAATFHRGLEQWLAGVPSDLPQDRRAEGRRRRGRIPVGSEGNDLRHQEQAQDHVHCICKRCSCARLEGCNRCCVNPGSANSGQVQEQFRSSTASIPVKYWASSGHVLDQL